MFIEIKKLLQVKTIAMENPNGFTLDIRSMELVKSGIAVAYAETQNLVGLGGLEIAIRHSIYNSGYIGGWQNPNGELQFDSVRIFHDLPKAIKWARKQKQYSIFDLDNGWEILI